MSTHQPVSLARLEAAHRKAAALVVMDEVYAPVFARLEAELVLARADSDPVAKARAILERQRAVA